MKANLSPINFYLLLSRGSIFNTKDLPPKYAYNLSLVGNNLMERIQSSEKLVKNFSMNSHHLFSLYRSAGQADGSHRVILRFVGFQPLALNICALTVITFSIKYYGFRG